MINVHETEIRVRYCETDAMGYLHHSHYASYFEVGRTELLRAQGRDYRDIEEQGLLFVVSKLSCHFIKPARYDDLLTIRTRTKRITAARMEHEYHIYRDFDLLTTGETVLACVDRDGIVQRLTKEILPELAEV